MSQVARGVTSAIREARRHYDLMYLLYVACGLVAAVPMMSSALCTSDLQMSLGKILSVSSMMQSFINV